MYLAAALLLLGGGRRAADDECCDPERTPRPSDEIAGPRRIMRGESPQSQLHERSDVHLHSQPGPPRSSRREDNNLEASSPAMTDEARQLDVQWPRRSLHYVLPPRSPELRLREKTVYLPDRPPLAVDVENGQSHTRRPTLCRGGCGKEFARENGRDYHWTHNPLCEQWHAYYVSGTDDEAEYLAALARRRKREGRGPRKYRMYSVY
ncbi:hypothetical protein AURDEDRAFT_109978 [Auricularia subglabra TFB-10046 SS5]|nr:hypothetical protein AURDEDRAFT_109978 [Auricularia subglabra TFB-10046 SS5]